MKTITTLSIAVITALFIGCGSGSSSGGDSDVSSSSTSNNNSSSSSSVMSSAENSSSASNSSSADGDLSSITVRTPKDVKGYRFTSKNVTISQISATYMVEFDCNDKFYYTQDMSYQGQSSRIETRGTDINVHDTAWGYRLDWIGTDMSDDPEIHNNNITIDAFDKITVDKSCFTDADCKNGFYVKSIEKIATCK